MNSKTKGNVAFIKRVREYVSTSYPNVLKLIAVQEDVFTGDELEFPINLISSETVGISDYSPEKLSKAFELIDDGEGILKVPNVVTSETVNEALQEFIDAPIEFFVVTPTGVSDTGGLHVNSYYSLTEPKKIIKYANSKPIEIYNKIPGIRDKNFEARFLNFYVYNNVFYFENNVPKTAEIIDATRTREGLLMYLVELLEKDSNSNGFAEKLRNRLLRYHQEKGNKITTSIILKCVGVFSKHSKNAELLDAETVNKLADLISSNKQTGRASMSTIQVVFSMAELGETKQFKTVNLYEKPYMTNNDENYCVTFNPNDTHIGEFVNIYRPLLVKGVLNDRDIEELKYMTNGVEIMNKFTEIIQREEMIPLLRLSQIRGTKVNIVTVLLVDMLDKRASTKIEKYDVVTTNPKPFVNNGNSNNYQKQSPGNNKKSEQTKSNFTKKTKQNVKNKEEIVYEEGQTAKSFFGVPDKKEKVILEKTENDIVKEAVEKSIVSSHKNLSQINEEDLPF